MRRNTIAKLLLATALVSVPTSALAQRRGRRGNNQGQAEQPQQGGGAAAGGGGQGDNGVMTFGADDPAANGQAQGGDGAAAGGDGAAAGGGGGGGDLLTGIGGEDVRARAHPLREQIYAVQQIYALRNRRLELTPTVGVSLNDPYVSHTGFGLGVNYWITNVLSAGLNFMWFQGLNGRSDVDFRVARSARLVVPINEYQMSAGLSFTYVPVYGKFLMFNRYIFHWDLYVMTGVGLIRTRPIAVVDPEVRTFEYNNLIMFNAGIGVRVFLNRWLGVVGEIRNYVYAETLENTTIAQMDQPVPMGGMAAPNSRQDPSTWIGRRDAITDNVMVHVGLTVFLPFQVSYRLQK